jgi:hypothetical protein
MLMLPTTAIFKTTLPFYFSSGTGNRKVFLPDPGVPAGVFVRQLFHKKIFSETGF